LRHIIEEVLRVGASANIYGKVKSMEAVRERIKGKGMIQIPREIMEKLRLSEGDEIALRIEASRLVIDPVTARRRMRLRTEIVDELVEREEFFEPEVV
jgi:antitoxin component of MazEF toxin-antitoxin module